MRFVVRWPCLEWSGGFWHQDSVQRLNPCTALLLHFGAGSTGLDQKQPSCDPFAMTLLLRLEACFAGYRDMNLHLIRFTASLSSYA